jgi:heme-degrading monooxygenase HmoA
MHARMTVMEGTPDRMDAAASQIEDDVLPLLRQQDGFKGFTVMGDRSTGKVVAVSFWESEQALKASDDAVRASRERSAQAVGASAGPRVEHYEVIVDVES